MKVFFRYAAVLLLFVQKANAQDLTFSQFYQVPILRNPALAGVFDGDIRVTGIFRNQWQSITVPYKTTALGTEVKIPFDRWNDWITIGAEFVSDEAGDIKLKRTQVLPVLNFHKSLSGNNDNFLSVAFMGGPVHSQFDPTQLTLDDQFQNGSYNPNNPSNQVFSSTGYTYWDLSAGLSYSVAFEDETHMYVGAAVFHFNNPKTNFYENDQATVIQRKYAVNFGLTTYTSDNNRLVAYADYFNQGGAEQFLAGLMYGTEFVKRYDDNKSINLFAGVFYRWNDAIIPMIQLDWYDLSFVTSYDVNISPLYVASNLRGGFEFSMSYRGIFNKRSYAAEKVICPSF